MAESALEVDNGKTYILTVILSFKVFFQNEEVEVHTIVLDPVNF